MNINYELYRLFYGVVENGSITKAAQVLNISQPAVSKAMKNLEEALGGKLFVRTKKGIVLTAEGREFYKYIKQAIENFNNAENNFSAFANLETGVVRIGVSTTLTKEFLMPYLKEFHHKYPKINIQIDTNVASDLFKKLRNGLIDIVIFNSSDKSYDEDLEITKCQKIEDCFIVSDKYKKLCEKAISIKDLNNYPLVLQTKESSTRSYLDDFAYSHGVILKPNLELASYSLVVEFSKIGFGIGFATSNYIQKELDNGLLHKVNLIEKLPSRYIAFALSKNNIASFSTKKLIEMISK